MKNNFNKNYLNCNDLIIKSMSKRRRLAIASISKIYNIEVKLKVVK